MRIVHVTFGLDIGGLEKLLLQYAEHTLPPFRPSFVCLGSDGPIGRVLRDRGFEVTLLDQPDGIRPGLWMTLHRHFRRLRPAVVHTHDIRPMIYAAPAAWSARVPVRVHTQHGRSIGGSSRQHRLVRFASRFVTDMVGVSGDIQDMVQASRWRPRHFWTIRNGIDPTPYAGRESDADAFRLLCVARLSPEKGVDVLVETFALLADSDPRWRLDIAGDGVCHGSLRQQIDRLNLSDRVRLLGAVDDVPERMKHAGIFVLPSRSEGISLTLLEAMFTGVPIVATAVGGTPEVVIDGQTGRLAESENPASLADAIRATIDDQNLERQIDRAKQMAADQFSVNTMMQRYDDIYQSRGRAHSPSGSVKALRSVTA